MDLKHFSHDHQLVFIQEWSRASEEEEEEGACCFACEERVEGPCYCCSGCKFFLHKTCAELELSPEVSHPFHPPHPLILLPKSPYSSSYLCDFCWGSFSGLVYHCASCKFDLDINCASIAGNFDKVEYPFHEHPLILIEKHNRIIRCDCLGCMKEISSSPFYKCLDCKNREGYLHKECAELPLEINNFHDRRHLLTLLQNPLIHLDSCSCYLCKIKWKGFVYYCNVCEFGLMLEDVSPLPEITTVNHEHPWTLLSRPMSFICDFCGTDGDRIPYLCTTCNFIVHKSCISLPRVITIMRHHHRLSHSYSLPENQFEKWECKICHKKVNTGYGSYYCPDSECNYIAHVNCATDRSIWDPKFNEDERSEGESINWITDVIQTKCLKGDEIATEIKHAFHDHNLTRTFSGEVKDDINCDGCMRPISTAFYGCEQCRFFLHRNCAELPREKRHPSHKHLLALTKNDEFVRCCACGRFHYGFNYECNKRDCYFEIDIQCSLLLDTFRHPSHKHLLFLDHNCRGNCSGCNNISPLAYKCTQGCEFILEFRCLTLPQIAWYKYDNHPLTLTYDEGSDPYQFYCDICEEERDSNKWFYYCADCDNAAHPECILGDLPFIKLGRTLKIYRHPHPLTFVKNIWNCPPCNVCKKLCNEQALQCTECNLIFHWKCQWDLPNLNGV
ncbi:PREDICTED: uncharacterized protein LOC18599231 isoform X1 [Theobroma cacao]|uniref:Uncharacterized protein LOC18599231 isoform X1 n=1 Tax=Theobroma cacao TaxID=3641 RepID=A0AB32V3K2_THECC|nr:PREDICTED: uncharacterized protein LOC18599231 isoform X1 [Theobroma cacao]